jgi:hypothetical protein
MRREAIRRCAAVGSKSLLLIAAAACAAAAGCGGASHTTAHARVAQPITAPRYPAATAVAQRDPNVYPEPVRSAFIRSCERGGTSPALCSCTFVALRQRYTARQFVELFRATGGREPDQVKQAAKACANS